MPNVEQTVMQEVMDVLDTLQLNVAPCHRALSWIMQRYIRLRISVHGNKGPRCYEAVWQQDSLPHHSDTMTSNTVPVLYDVTV